MDGIEGERGLAGTGQAGHDDQFVFWNIDRNIFEIVDASATDGDVLGGRHDGAK